MTQKKKRAKGMFVVSKALGCNLTVAKKITKCLLNQGTIETLELINQLLPDINCYGETIEYGDDGSYTIIKVDNTNLSELFWEKV